MSYFHLVQKLKGTFDHEKFTILISFIKEVITLQKIKKVITGSMH